MPESGSELVAYEVRDGVAWARIDNGKANALSFDVLGGLDRCLTLAEDDAAVGALVITGTPGFLTGGFDLTVMQGDDPAAMIRLVSDGGALFTRLFASSLPVVVAAARARGRGRRAAAARGRRAHRRRRHRSRSASSRRRSGCSCPAGRSSSRRSG